jgi:hypothetical protein
MIGIGVLVAALTAQVVNPASGADAILLRDNRVLLGQVVDQPRRGRILVVVRRAWIRKHLPDHAAIWEKVEAAASARARDQRRARLVAWRLERPADATDRLTAWMDAEIERLTAKAGEPAPLLVVEIGATQARRVDRRSPDAARILRQAWRAGLEDPESRPVDELRRLLEGRGVALSDVDPAPIQDLIALAPEPDATWLARRAATEVLNDPGLRYVRFRDLVLPEDAQAGPGSLAAAAAATLKGLLDDGPAEDPLAPAFGKAEERRRIGLVVTRLELGDDQASATVEGTLWIRVPPGRWIPAATRSVTHRAGDAQPEDVARVANDPQVRLIFKLFEGLGLGPVGQEIQGQARQIGAVTMQALGRSRSELMRDLESLALPVDR